MLDQEYKGWHIFHDYQHIAKLYGAFYEEINRYVIWTPDMLDMVAEEFETLEEAKSWVDDNRGAYNE